MSLTRPVLYPPPVLPQCRVVQRSHGNYRAVLVLHGKSLLVKPQEETQRQGVDVSGLAVRLVCRRQHQCQPSNGYRCLLSMVCTKEVPTSIHQVQVSIFFSSNTRSNMSRFLTIIVKPSC
jgi:hypothetical protein